RNGPDGKQAYCDQQGRQEKTGEPPCVSSLARTGFQVSGNTHCPRASAVTFMKRPKQITTLAHAMTTDSSTTRKTNHPLKTGVPGLDDVLGGGFAPGRLYLAEGIPGSGKTTIAMQFLMEGVRSG